MTPEQLRRHAADILLDHARDVESLSISEHLENLELPAAEHDEACAAIDDLISKATVTVSWPDSEPTDEETRRA